LQWQGVICAPTLRAEVQLHVPTALLVSCFEQLTQQQ